MVGVLGEGMQRRGGAERSGGMTGWGICRVEQEVGSETRCLYDERGGLDRGSLFKI